MIKILVNAIVFVFSAPFAVMGVLWAMIVIAFRGGYNAVVESYNSSRKRTDDERRKKAVLDIMHGMKK